MFSNTDTLANGIDTNEIVVKLFQYSNSGNHKNIFTSKTNLSSLNVAALE